MRLTDKEKQAARILARKDLYFFSRYMFYTQKGYAWQQSPHHKIICDYLMRVYDGDIQNLIINLPPRYSKTQLAVIYFIAWALGNHPDCEFIHSSYSSTLASNNSSQIRDLLQNEEYQAIFNTRLKDDSKAKDHWKTTQGGVMYATGAGGTITGFGAGKLRDGFGGCFPLWQKVVTDKGDLSFKEIKEYGKPLRALSYNKENGNLEFQPIDTFWTNPSNDIYGVILNDGSYFEATSDHKIMTANGYVEVKDLTRESLILSSFSDVLNLGQTNIKQVANFLPCFGSIQNDCNFFWRMFWFILPVGIRDMLRDALPCFSSFDLPDYGATDTVNTSEFISGFFTGEYFNNLLSSEFGGRAIFEQWESTMLDSVLHIIGLATIGEIFKSVIMGVSVEVSNLFTSHSLTDEGLCDKLVNVFDLGFRVYGNIDPKIPLVVITWLKDFFGQFIMAVFAVYSSCMAFNTTKTANAIQSLKANYRTPLFIGKVAHVNSTYCLEVRHNNNFILSQSQVVVSNCICIDDPHKADEARSETMRANVINWFTETIKSRRNDPSKTPIIIIMQRLHENDLSGYLLAGNDDDDWQHLKLPAIQADGTALWEQKHSIDKLRQMQIASPYMFAGQYMQEPAPLDGGVFKPSNIEIIDAVPQGNIKWVRGWDLGATVGGDPTAGAKLGKLPDGRLVIADMVHGDVSSDDRDRMMKNTASQDGKGVLISIPQDPGQAGKTQVQYLVKLLQGYKVHTSTETGDKVTRAEPFASQVNVGNVLMVKGDWNQGVIDEMRMFPNGAYDDRIDGLSRAYSQLIDSTFTYNNV